MALRNIAKKEPKQVPVFKISAASSPIHFITNLAFFFSFELDPGTGSSAVHGQEPWPGASHALLHRPVWNQAFSWFGDSTCQHCEDRGESAVSELYLLSHEVPEQEHLHRPLISVRILFSLQSTSTNRPGDFPTRGSLFVVVCSAAACNIALRMLSPKLNRLSLRFSRAIHLDVYNSKAFLSSGSSPPLFFSNIPSLVTLSQVVTCSALLPMLSTSTMLPAFCPEISWRRPVHMFLEPLLMFWRWEEMKSYIDGAIP